MAESYAIQAELSLKDNMSPVFGSIAKNTDGMSNKLKGMAGSCLSISSGMKNASTAVNGLSGAMDSTVSKYGQLSQLPQIMTNLSEGAKTSSSGFQELGGVISSISGIFDSVTEFAKAMQGIAALGAKAVTPLVTFGAVVGGLAVVFSVMGANLQKNMEGISAFGEAVSSIASAMAPLLSTGIEGAQIMTVFAYTIAALAAVFAAFGQKLNMAVPGMLAFGSTILLVGEGLSRATPFITAFTLLVQQLGNTIAQVAGSIASSIYIILGAIGNLAGSIASAVALIVTAIGGTLCNIMVTAGATISKVVDSISEGFSKVSEGVTQIIDAISGGLSDVLNSIAGVIESVGISAKNAGEGFKLVAEGIQILTKLNILKVGVALLEVATGIGLISTKGKNLPQVAQGMQNLMMAIALGMLNIAAFNLTMSAMSAIIPIAITNIDNLQAAFNEFVITPPDISLFIAAFNQIIATSMMLVPALTLIGNQAGIGLAKGLSSGAGIAASIVAMTAALIVSALSVLAVHLSLIGNMAGRGFASGLQSGLSRAASITALYISQINAAMISAQSDTYRAGRNIGIGLALGMESCLGRVRRAAAQLAAAANMAIRAKAEINSPSKVTTAFGKFYGIGFVKGIESKIPAAEAVAKRLVNIPILRQAEFAMVQGGYSGSVSGDYIYGNNGTYIIEVPVNIDGREVSRVTAPFMQSELNRLDMRESRKRGKR